MPSKERLLVVVRTYPDLSQKYEETVCTAAINEAGDWRRLYPVPLRYLAEEQQYRVGSIIRARLSSTSRDDRVESRRVDLQTLSVENQKLSMQARHEWIDAGETFASWEALQAAGRSIGPVKVTSVQEFIAEPRSAQWSDKERQVLGQEMLHAKRLDLEKIPFRFRLRWTDGDGKELTTTFRSWEVCETWRQWHRQYGPEEVIERMKKQWLTKVLPPGRDIRFFLGNLSQPKLRHVFQITGTHTAPKDSSDAGLFTAT